HVRDENPRGTVVGFHGHRRLLIEFRLHALDGLVKFLPLCHVGGHGRGPTCFGGGSLSRSAGLSLRINLRGCVKTQIEERMKENRREDALFRQTRITPQKAENERVESLIENEGLEYSRNFEIGKKVIERKKNGGQKQSPESRMGNR